VDLFCFMVYKADDVVDAVPPSDALLLVPFTV
jgi:hypothetical protein